MTEALAALPVKTTVPSLMFLGARVELRITTILSRSLAVGRRQVMAIVRPFALTTNAAGTPGAVRSGITTAGGAAAAELLPARSTAKTA